MTCAFRARLPTVSAQIQPKDVEDDVAGLDASISRNAWVLPLHDDIAPAATCPLSAESCTCAGPYEALGAGFGSVGDTGVPVVFNCKTFTSDPADWSSNSTYPLKSAPIKAFGAVALHLLTMCRIGAHCAAM